MGYGGFLTILNGSPHDFALSGQHSYQMDTWSWPTIQAGTSAKVYVEFGTKGNTGDDGGEAYYNIAGTSEKFSVLGRKPRDYQLTISLDGLSTKQSPQGSKVELGFRHDAAVNWILSTDEADQWWSNSGTTTDWMQQSLGSLGNRTLKHIALPGSHDAGMSSYKPGTVGAHFANTQAQYLDFYGQLMVGSRYFDLRPVISNGKWVSGHYSEIEGPGIWLGGNGQPILDIVKQVNDFTRQYKELVIINLSHTLDTDHDYKDLSQDQWNQLFDTLKGIENRFTVQNPGNTDFSNKVLGDFITDRASVFIVAQLPNGISLGNYANEGFYNQNNFPFYDSYSNSNKADDMENDQLSKLKAERNIVADSASRKDKFHILSWTLTQQPEDVLNFDKAIMNLGTSVYDHLFDKAFNAFTPESFPNVLYVDSLGIRDKSVVFPFDKPRSVPTTNDIAALAIAINNAKAGRNGYVTGQN
ncbi:PLC-like phosphodiesterase [Aaosphaeria arxii CBS 175.79]|uniref:PLC-like phosphodiesterase n=1 Tax=Aaosphaeria arxii CBS 175.79 TaxID=1450172 RepID=A0A6A5Y536_9PLEO|nr:PLC-like phosphodiesterase [Aaosphaeria arxii CBS 175.79]KAF2019644.1 PLC-like phosphodiesterase [Aaosphaeria arxii CBS 175.79]